MRKENWTITARREASGAIVLRAERIGASFDADGTKDAIWHGRQLPTARGMVSTLESMLYASAVGAPLEVGKPTKTARTIRATLERG